jgi:hypothetical protein
MTISDGRRCALPGCYVVIEPEPDGRPQRKYCTAAHRAVARQMRREGIHRSATAPPLPLPAPPLPLPPIAPPPTVNQHQHQHQRRRQLTETTARRARAVAVLGSAGLLVTGGGLMAASSPVGQPGSMISAAPWVPATPEAEQNWAEQARVSLASLESQLAEVNQAEQNWNALPEPDRADPAPPAVRALGARRRLLEQQRATLISELGAWDSMSVASRRLADTEAHVASLDRALKEVPRNRALTRSEADTAAQLGEQRNLRVRQRDSQREELDNLRQGLHEAMASPLPDDPTATKAITSRVTDLVRHPSKRQDGNHNNPLTGSHRPEITAQREQKTPGRRDVGSGAPPVPGKSKTESARGSSILAEPGSPSQKGSLGRTVDNTAKPLERPQAAGDKPGAAGGQSAGADKGHGGLTDQPVSKPVERTSHDTSIGPSAAPKTTKTAPADQRRSTPAPRTNAVPKSAASGGASSPDQKVRDANRISGAVSRGNMNDMVSTAMEAKRHQDQAKGSGGSKHSGYSKSRSSGGSSGLGGSKHSRSSGGSGYGSSDIGRMIEKYSSGGGGSKKSHGSHGSSGRNSKSYSSFFGSSGHSGPKKSYRSSGHGFGGFF